MWDISLHWWEFVIRAVVVYGFLMFALRIAGKRQIGQMAQFDFVLLLILSNAVQNSMNGGDNSITGGLILALTLIVVNAVVSWVTYRSRKMEWLIEGRPIILVHEGKIDHASMRQANMTKHELDAAIRTEGLGGSSEVRYAILENSGKVSIIPFRSGGGKDSQSPDSQ